MPDPRESVFVKGTEKPTSEQTAGLKVVRVDLVDLRVPNLRIGEIDGVGFWTVVTLDGGSQPFAIPVNGREFLVERTAHDEEAQVWFLGWTKYRGTILTNDKKKT
ncbi:hypothetical protein D9613_009887 [Agrocybe pediades]|uniref:Uncharacterized protein n=1 Tax=Agrocybe pediades TaxID=84607 RepID=A0A8H4VQL3_9AGAR|nr:hypothetical protein D9613_009887 [Agrocybe pediades]